MCDEHAGSVDSNQFASAQNTFAPVDPLAVHRGGKHDGFGKKEKCWYCFVQLYQDTFSLFFPAQT